MCYVCSILCVFKVCTVQSRFSDILLSDKSRFSDSSAEDHFLVHKNVSFSDNLLFSATLI